MLPLLLPEEEEVREDSREEGREKRGACGVPFLLHFVTEHFVRELLTEDDDSLLLRLHPLDKVVIR